MWGAAERILLLAETQCCLAAGFGTRELKAAYRLCPQPALRRWCHPHFQIWLLPIPSTLSRRVAVVTVVTRSGYLTSNPANLGTALRVASYGYYGTTSAEPFVAPST